MRTAANPLHLHSSSSTLTLWGMKAQKMKADAEAFFLSEDFSAYSSVDGKQILKMLKEESEAKYGRR